MMILEQTIKEMPHSFTSNEFNKRAVKNGYPSRSLKKKGLSNFLRKYADNAYHGSKTWVKKDATRLSMTNEEMIDHLKSEGYNIMTDQEMVEYLKSKGLKIMKPVNEWVEC